MSMKSKKRQRRQDARETLRLPRHASGGKKYYAAVFSAFALLAASFAATRFEPLRRAVGARPLSVASTQQNALPLSKEYIYAGGRLLATEEPTPAATLAPTPAGPAPTNLIATASFPSASSAVVKLTWSAPSSGSAPSSYIVERAVTRDAANGLQYVPVSPSAATLPTQASPYVDRTAMYGRVYVYRVRAVYVSGASGYSNQDLAATVRYSGDDPLVGANDPQGRPRSVVRATDLNELHRVIDAVRSLAGVGPAVWKADPGPASRGSILAAHFRELRDNLNPALAALGLTVMPDDPTLVPGLPVKTAHVQDVRDKVR
jgi:hypothetical protein